MIQPEFTLLDGYREFSVDEMRMRSREFLAEMRRRRTVRSFADRTVPRDVIENCIGAAGTAPSGANIQPWHFVAVTDSAVKRQIREAAEREERLFYQQRAPQSWLDALAPLGTDQHKPFLEVAPYLIVVMAQVYGLGDDETIVKHYYVSESVGIATGMLITAVHHAGLVSLTHTPSPMEFLNEILDRPRNERPFLILAVGYPANDAMVPVIRKKTVHEITTWI